MRHDYGAERKVFAGWKALINELLEYEALFLKMQDGQWFHYSHKSDLKGLMWSQVQSFKVEKMNRDNGWINGYKWGEEYPTNGKKPDLPDDVLVSFEPQDYRTLTMQTCNLKDLPFKNSLSFRIVDERYKPKSEPLGNPEQLDNSWYTRGELPPVGTECEYAIEERPSKTCTFVGINSRGSIVIEDCNGEYKSYHAQQIKLHPIKTERERFIDAALKQFDEYGDQFPEIENKALFKLFGGIYDAGFRAPEGK